MVSLMFSTLNTGASPNVPDFNLDLPIIRVQRWESLEVGTAPRDVVESLLLEGFKMLLNSVK